MLHLCWQLEMSSHVFSGKRYARASARQPGCSLAPALVEVEVEGVEYTLALAVAILPYKLN